MVLKMYYFKAFLLILECLFLFHIKNAICEHLQINYFGIGYLFLITGFFIGFIINVILPLIFLDLKNNQNRLPKSKKIIITLLLTLIPAVFFLILKTLIINGDEEDKIVAQSFIYGFTIGYSYNLLTTVIVYI